MSKAGAVISRRRALAGVLGAASIPFVAATLGAAVLRPVVARAGEAGPAGPVQAFNSVLLRIMKSGTSTPFAARYAMLEPAVARAFDLDSILRVSVGAQWATMAPDQQATLSASFRRYTIANFVANFDTYVGQTIVVSPESRALANGDQVVNTRIAGADGSPVELSYVMRQGRAGWQAVDVLAQGSISRVATQRSDFRSVLSNGGSAALVSSLEGKVAALSGGSLA